MADDEKDVELYEESNGSFINKLWMMLPEPIRRVTTVAFTYTCNTLKGIYNFGRTASWLFFSSSILLFIPLILEVERAEIENVQQRQRNQLLFGSSSGASISSSDW